MTEKLLQAVILTFLLNLVVGIHSTSKTQKTATTLQEASTSIVSMVQRLSQ